MAEPISIQQLKDASEDAITLADFIYKPANVMIPRRLAADINSLQYYLDYMSSYAQHSYETYDEMVANAVNLSENVSVFVTNDLDATKNGIYTYNGTSFVKGEYQPENVAKDFVESKLGGLEVFDGKVRAQDVSTVDGSTQDVKNNEFRSELDALPFVDGLLPTTKVSYLNTAIGAVSRTLHDKLRDSVSVKDFGAKGDGVTDDTQALKSAIAACKQGGSLQKTLFIPVGVYVINEMITIDNHISIVGESNAGNSWQHYSPTLFFPQSSGFDFTKTADYCHISNIYIKGTKTGFVDLLANEFGHFGMRFSQGAAGKFENIRINYFDCGRVSYTNTAAGATYGGAYRYFNYFKFNYNTYAIVQQGFTTDDNFFQCDFHNGRIYINSEPTGGYQTTNFIDCMFEALGTDYATPINYDNYGIIIKGNSHVKIIGGYSENAPVFVDKRASLNTSCNLVCSSNSLRHSGGGIINVSEAFPHFKQMALPSLSSTELWTLHNLQANSTATRDGKSGYRYKVIAGDGQPFMQVTGDALNNAISMDSIPYHYDKLLVQYTIEYKAPAGRTLTPTWGSTGPATNTWAQSDYYDNTEDWRRKSDIIPFYTQASSTAIEFIPFYLQFVNAQVDDVFLIRSIVVNVLAY